MRPTSRAAAVVIALGLTALPSAQVPQPVPSPRTSPFPRPPQTPVPAPQPPSPAPPAQEQQPDQRPTPFRTEANFVRVDVYPTVSGKPVLDLAAADFEVAEDGVAQKVETFEHVVVRPAGPQADRVEPSSVREMQQAAANPRHRVFLIFLDGPHVTVAGSHNITEPLIRLINRILGPDDLVGIMTPTMSADQVVLARRTEVTEEQLRKYWTWGSRFGLMKDDREEGYLVCYPPTTDGPIAANMIARKRERVTLEALEDLVRYMNGIREERKAILTVTEGWSLFTPDPSLEKLSKNAPIPSADPVGIGPNGKLTTRNPRDSNSPLTKMDCDADRMRLASMDDERFLRDIIDQANRSNSSFYPIDPRGLVAFDTPIDQALPLDADARSLRNHQTAMRTLAEATDGLAVMGSNDLDKGLRQISDDLSSYYLLGYYSTNSRVDGGYRTLKVRVKRPGVAVRARRGYRAASAEEVARARTAAAAPAVDVTAPIQSALSMLASVRPDARVRLHATPGSGSDLLWVAGELASGSAQADGWAQGATADLQISSGGATAVARVTIRPGDHTFLTSIKRPPGDTAIDLQVRVSPADRGPAVTETVRVAATPQPLFYRRGPATANRQVATADLRFTRAERAHLELPVGADARPGAGRLLDRMGKPLTVPVTIGERTDEASGQHWITADLTLAPLAPSDYIVEMGMIETSGETRVVTGIRVVR